MDDAPGGGYIATILDAENFPVSFIFGQTPVSKGALPEKMVWNDETEKPRVRRFQRFSPGPSPIFKVSPVINEKCILPPRKVIGSLF